MQTMDLSGAELDYWVAKAEGKTATLIRHPMERDVGCFADGNYADRYCPSADWSQGGPIIERERDAICDYLIRTGETITWLRHADLGDWMRAYVASKFGEEVPPK